MECWLHFGRDVPAQTRFSGKNVFQISSDHLIQASTDVAQLEVISKLCGIPDPAAWPEIIHYKHFKTLVTPLLTRFHPKPRRKIAEQFCALPPDALDVLDGLLRLNPKTRLSATEALQSNQVIKRCFLTLF